LVIFGPRGVWGRGGEGERKRRMSAQKKKKKKPLESVVWLNSWTFWMEWKAGREGGSPSSIAMTSDQCAEKLKGAKRLELTRREVSRICGIGGVKRISPCQPSNG